MPELAVRLAVTRQFESVERKPLAALQCLHVQLARATLGHTERALSVLCDLAREPDRDSRTERTEADIDQVAFTREVDDRDPVRESGVSVLVVDDARQVERHVKAELGEHFEEQSVLLEAIAATAPQHDARIERLGIERQRVAEPWSDTAERELRDVTRRHLRQELERRRFSLQAQGVDVPRSNLGAVHGLRGGFASVTRRLWRRSMSCSRA
jgi:hypothetical protein